MSLTNEEKTIIEESLSVYLQILARQAPPAQVQQLAQICQGIIKKLDNTKESVDNESARKPNGITDDWFKNVCSACAKLTASGCSDKVTEKVPGKCDPILHYERDKLLNKN
jgi:hypothetical protein